MMRLLLVTLLLLACEASPAAQDAPVLRYPTVTRAWHVELHYATGHVYAECWYNQAPPTETSEAAIAACYDTVAR